MNCSQKLISLIFGTTDNFDDMKELLLWIALKSWYLWYSEQLGCYVNAIQISCELLSKVDIFDIRYNMPIWGIICGMVVNCSQKLISLIFGTTVSLLLLSKGVVNCLKSWYLWYSNNTNPSGIDILWVVNCSQKLISLIFGTTLPKLPENYPVVNCLKSWYLWYSEQQRATS